MSIFRLYKPEFIYESRRSGAFSFCFDKLHNTALKHRLGWFGVDNYAITSLARFALSYKKFSLQNYFDKIHNTVKQTRRKQ